MVPFGVKVLCIEPGFFKTNVTDATILTNNVNMLWERLPKETQDDYGTEYLKKCKFGSKFFFFIHTYCYSSIYLFHSFSLLALAVISDKVSKMTDGDLMKVVSCMEHAVSAVRPRTRYSPGWDAKLFWLPLSYMPSCFTDYLINIEAIPIAKQEQ